MQLPIGTCPRAGGDPAEVREAGRSPRRRAFGLSALVCWFRQHEDRWPVAEPDGRLRLVCARCGRVAITSQPYSGIPVKRKVRT